MTSLPSSSDTANKGPNPSASHDTIPQVHQESDLASPMLRWLHQSDKDEPWRGFTVVSTDTQHGQSYSYATTDNKRSTWSTKVESGSAIGQ
ncbi:hypothetical protein FDECE_18096 [Fusarium decemcellulare]|nr:hypothetical protein FDECE_18096 [Fusarium decemcellulare]